MKTANFITSSCRYCRYYKTEGRRGGMCQQLGVPVQANWKACAFAIPPFASTWESLDTVVLLENSLSLPPANDFPAPKTSDSEPTLPVKQATVA
jgi:hypothetical protein